jgi:hypothetical protein
MAVAALAAAALSVSASAQTIGKASWSANQDDALLFDVRLGQYRVGDGVRGYSTPGGVCVDFADMIMTLDLAIRLDKKSRRATGWAFDERHTVTIDRETAKEQITNIVSNLPENAIHDTPEGWCVDTKILSRWLGITVAPDLSNALLWIKSATKLPLERGLERRARAATIRPSAIFDLKSLPHAEVAFAGFKMPTVDVVASAGGLRDSRNGNRTDVRYELYASGEAGPFAYDARLSSNQHGVPANLRVRAYRTDPDAKLLGPLHATHFALGDVSGLSTPLVSQSSVGRGAIITNRPIERQENFDRTNFRGELPNGWDAELYRNGQLLGFAMTRADGRYEFLDVPLLYGQNRFEVVLYGPQGQVRREPRTVSVGLDSIPPKQTWYWAGLNEDGHDLINLGNDGQFRKGGWRGSVGVERGIDARTSVSAQLHTLTLDDVGRRSYVEAAVRRAIGPALFELSGAVALHGGTAIRGQVIGEWNRTFFSLETINAFGGFRSDRVTQNVTGLHTVSVDHSFNLGRTVLPVHLESRYTKRSGGDHSVDAAVRVSTNLGRLSVTGELSTRNEFRHFGPDPPGQTEFAILGNGRIGRIRLRGEARYRISPESRFESATLVGEWSTGGGEDVRQNNWRAEIGYDRPLNRGHVGLGYTRRFDKFAVTGTGEVATDGSVAAGIDLAFSFGRNPRTGGLRISSEKLAAHGTALVRVFRDLNHDGIRQVGEPGAKDVGLSAGRTPVLQQTDDQGYAVIDGLEPYEPVLIGIDAGSLPDPLIQPGNKGMVVTPRPGITVAIDLPLASAGEVDGTLVRSGGTTLEGVDLELVDAENRIVGKTRSDFDGFFLFEGVPYGRYTIRIAKLSAEAAELAPSLAGLANVGDATPSVHLGAVAADGSGTRTAAE